MKFLNIIDGANKLKQDTSYRLVSNLEKETWNGKAEAIHPHTISEVADLEDELNKRAFERISVKKKIESYTLSLNDNTILVDSSSKDIVLTLPSTSLAKGKIYKIKKISNENIVMINSDSIETIDGELSYIIEYKYQSIELVCDGIEWYVM